MSENPEEPKPGLQQRIAHGELPQPSISLAWLRRLQKTYDRGVEITDDRATGATTFFVMNLVMYAVVSWIIPTYLPEWQRQPAGRLLIQLLPWLANGLFLLLAFLFRPQMAIGYLICFGGILLIGFGLFAVLVTSCLVSIPVILVVPPLGGVVLVILLIVGGIWMLAQTIGIIGQWWGS